jgi:hypothetical protein
MKKTRVLIAGGGFAGFSAAQYFEGLSGAAHSSSRPRKAIRLNSWGIPLDTSAQDE